MKGVFSVLSLVFLGISANAFEVTDKDFEEVVLKSGKASFVKFYASWCSHCKAMAPAWEALDHKYEDNDSIQFIEYDGDKNKKFTKKYSIQGFPTLKLFKPDELDNPVEFVGSRDTVSLGHFLGQNLGWEPKEEEPKAAEEVKEGEAESSEESAEDTPAEPVKEVRVVSFNDTNFDSSVGDKSVFILFTREGCAECDQWAPTWEQLADAFHLENHRVVIGTVNADESSSGLVSRFNVKQYPTIVFIDKKADKTETFEGASDISQLVDYLNLRLNTQRATNGKLRSDARTIPDMDEKLVEFVVAPPEQKARLAQIIVQNLRTVDQSVYQEEVKYYVRLISVLITSDSRTFVVGEKKRLQKLRTDIQLDEVQEDKLQMKLNLLQQCEDGLNGKKEVPKDEL